jgi:hypothetical protein
MGSEQKENAERPKTPHENTPTVSFIQPTLDVELKSLTHKKNDLSLSRY